MRSSSASEPQLLEVRASAANGSRELGQRGPAPERERPRRRSAARGVAVGERRGGLLAQPREPHEVDGPAATSSR